MMVLMMLVPNDLPGRRAGSRLGLDNDVAVRRDDARKTHKQRHDQQGEQHVVPSASHDQRHSLVR
ncbi:MAG: hypothetical protein ACUVT2_00500 [Thiobacillaceae bacterium]